MADVLHELQQRRGARETVQGATPSQQLFDDTHLQVPLPESQLASGNNFSKISTVVAKSDPIGEASTMAKEVKHSLAELRIHKERCRQFYTWATDLLTILENSAEGRVDDRNRDDAATEVTSILRRSQTKIKEWSQFGLIRSFLKRKEITYDLKGLKSSLEAVYTRYQIAPSMAPSNYVRQPDTSTSSHSISFAQSIVDDLIALPMQPTTERSSMQEGINSGVEVPRHAEDDILWRRVKRKRETVYPYTDLLQEPKRPRETLENVGQAAGESQDLGWLDDTMSFDDLKSPAAQSTFEIGDNHRCSIIQPQHTAAPILSAQDFSKETRFIPSSAKSTDTLQLPLISPSLMISPESGSLEVVISKEQNAVEAGTLEGLINFMIVQPIGKARHVKVFRGIFLATYPAFTSADIVLEGLINQFDYVCSQDCEPRIKSDISFNVLAILRQWLETFPAEADDWDVLVKMNSFVSRMKDPETVAHDAERLIDELIEPKLKRLQDIQLQDAQIGDPIQSTYLRGSTPRARLSELTPRGLAECLTHINGMLFYRIRPTDLVTYLRNPNPNPNAPISLLKHKSEQLMAWVQRVILRRVTTHDRARKIAYFVETAFECKALRNFASLWAIIVALQSRVVMRLRRTKECISPKILERLRHLTDLTDSQNNYGYYRKSLGESRGPVLPMIFVHLRSIRYTNSKIPSQVPGRCGPLINFQKYAKLHTRIQDILKYTVLTYNLQPTERYLHLVEQQLHAIVLGEKLDKTLEAASLNAQEKEEREYRSYSGPLEDIGMEASPSRSDPVNQDRVPWGSHTEPGLAWVNEVAGGASRESWPTSDSAGRAPLQYTPATVSDQYPTVAEEEQNTQEAMDPIASRGQSSVRTSTPNQPVDTTNCPKVISGSSFRQYSLKLLSAEEVRANRGRAHRAAPQGAERIQKEIAPLRSGGTPAGLTNSIRSSKSSSEKPTAKAFQALLPAPGRGIWPAAARSKNTNSSPVDGAGLVMPWSPGIYEWGTKPGSRANPSPTRDHNSTVNTRSPTMDHPIATLSTVGPLLCQNAMEEIAELQLTQTISNIQCVHYGEASEVWCAVYCPNKAPSPLVKVTVRYLRKHCTQSDANFTIALESLARKWKSWDHPHIMPLLYLESTLKPRTVTPWYEHGHLSSLGVALYVTNRHRLLLQITCGLAYLHGNQTGPTVHGNLKPEVIYIDDSGDAKIGGFESPLAILDGHQHVFNSVVHDVRYKAPELLEGSPPSLASDTYSLALIGIELFSGVHPFDSLRGTALAAAIASGRGPNKDDHRELSDHGEDMWPIFERMWDQDPSSRPTASQVAYFLSSTTSE
ncbi:hypothetical protein FRB94_012774 [Tulasnella sp. JGI-2019a]|nr:hypothetical protein FRB94_012774 [Tulasnella sp. JGI-2019a]KAG9018487.1 hypothetical protein FRB93_000190 [Tulasnella sp. JGI-2019a]